MQTTAPLPAETPPPVIQDRAAMNAEIRSIGKISGLDQAWTDGQIDAAATVADARAAAFGAMQTRSQAGAIRTTVNGGMDHADPANRVRAMGEALATRFLPGHVPSGAARPYIGMTMVDFGRDCLRSHNISTTGLSPASIIDRSLHSTSDFPGLMSDGVGRVLRTAYAAPPSGLKLVARQTLLRDFRAKHAMQFSEAPRLLPVNESGEFTHGTMSEGKETISLKTAGRIFGITRQLLVNDDLGAIADVARRFGQSSLGYEGSVLAGLLAGVGPTMSDGKALFHVDHGNLAAVPAAITTVSLSAARMGLRKQTGLAGELISVTPKFLVVSPDKETEAELALATIAAAKTADANPFTGLTLIVEPRLTGNAWYLTADPAEIDGMEYAYLEGEPGPQVFTETGFDIDGVKIKCRLDFGAGFLDWRGWYRNAGA